MPTPPGTSANLDLQEYAHGISKPPWILCTKKRTHEFIPIPLRPIASSAIITRKTFTLFMLCVEYKYKTAWEVMIPNYEPLHVLWIDNSFGPSNLITIAVCIGWLTVAICAVLNATVNAEDTYLSRRRNDSEYTSELVCCGCDPPQQYVFATGISCAAFILLVSIVRVKNYTSCIISIQSSNASLQNIELQSGCCCKGATLERLNGVQAITGCISALNWSLLSIVSLSMNEPLHDLFATCYFLFGYIFAGVNTSLWYFILRNEGTLRTCNDIRPDAASESTSINPSNREKCLLYLPSALWWLRVKQASSVALLPLTIIHIFIAAVLRMQDPNTTYYMYAGPLLQYTHAVNLSLFILSCTNDVYVGTFGANPDQSIPIPVSPKSALKEPMIDPKTQQTFGENII